MDDLISAILDETVQESASKIVGGIAKSIHNAKGRSPSYQSRLLKPDELENADRYSGFADSEHPEHEGACERSPEGVEGDSDEGEYQPSLTAIPTEGNPENPPENKDENIPEDLLKADAPPMQKREALRPQYQITPQELRKSIITAEILGKPLALRKKYR